MARIKIPFKGVASQSNYQDGECKNIVNLRPKKGVYRPVTPRKVLQTLNDDYDIVFVHKGSGYENWIGIINDTSFSSIHTNIKTSPTTLQYLNEKINSVQQTGDILSFISDNNIYYAIYKSTGYSFLGTIPDLPAIRIGAYNEFTLKWYYDQEYSGLGSVDSSSVARWKDEMLMMTKGLVNKALDVIINGGTAKGGTVIVGKGAVLSDAHLLRYAFRLYDGTVIKHSTPLLVMPASNILDLKKVFLKDDPTYTFPDPSGSYVEVTVYNLGVSVDLFGYGGWSDIIKSIDIYLSAPLGFSNIETLSDDRARSFVDAQDVVHRLIDSLDKEALKKLGTESNFYLIKSLPINEWSNPTTPYIIPTDQSEITKLDNLIYQELMPVETLSHHDIGSTNSSVFNNRLRISDIKTTFFKGFSSEHFRWVTDYNGVAVPGIFSSMLIAEVELMINGKKEYVYSFYRNYFGEAEIPFFQPFLSYPDPRAKKITFYTDPTSGDGNWTKFFTAELNEHQGLNLAYFVNDNLVPIQNTGGTVVSEKTVTYRPSIIENNKLKVSEINNPLIFPNETTYLIGSGKILVESSIVMNVSDRNYGMYPVFIFTTDGVFTMAGQDADTVHASIQAPTYLEPPISKVICATPYGVVFITNRGLMQISNYKTESLSEILREDDDVLNIDLTGITDPAAGYPSVSFREFLKTATSMVYNPYHDELIISASGYPYNYVYDYETKSFYLSTNLIGLMVQNTFPDVYYITDRNIMDISQSGSDVSKVALLTRPLQFQSTDIKKLERIFLRALMYNAHGVRVVAYHSMDGVNFSPIKGFAFGSGGNYKDFDLGLLARETFRQYLFLLTGEVDEKSEIDYIDCEVRLNYNNEKMR